MTEGRLLLCNGVADLDSEDVHEEGVERDHLEEEEDSGCEGPEVVGTEVVEEILKRNIV